MPAVLRRLPGIAFEAPSPALDDALPRMDVAGFVGLARTGPIGVPVAVHDPAEFVAVFGEAPVLLREAATGERVSGLLADAVGAFFRNGGRRCWVVRVSAATQRATVEVPGLVRLDGAGRPVPVELRAASVGSWSDGLAVAAGVLRSALPQFTLDSCTLPAGKDPGTVRGQLAAVGAVRPGDLVEVAYGGHRRLTFAVVEVAGAAVAGEAPLWASTDPSAAPAVLAGVPVDALGVAARAAVLTLELRTRLAERDPVAVRGLGFAPRHPRYVGGLPTDEQLHRCRPTADVPLPPEAPLWTDVARPRLPLAGFAAEAPVLHPFGLDASRKPQYAAARGPAGHSADDLLTDFVPKLFLDPDIARAGADTLLATADFVRDTGPAPRPLTGIHALLDVAEVTLVAVPDAVHRVWEPAAPLRALEAPGHQPYVPPRPCPHGDVPTFADVAGTDIRLPSEPVLAVGPPDDLGTVHVSWKPIEEPTAPVRYVLEESTDPATWAGARELYRGSGTDVVLFGRSAGTYFYRVRAEDDAGRASTWSDGLAVPMLLDDPGARPAAFDPTLLETVHAALLRMCAARGDLLAVLALPQHYRTADVEAHVAAVREELAPGGRSDDRVLSFGALYHPWVVADRPIPPDGPAAGVLAAIALRRGCWVAPANTPLAGVVALAPAVPPADPQRLQDTGANTVRQVPRGFLWLSADTLCTDPDLRQVTVRRLLSLLRRTALDRGPAHTFEPLGEVLRRQVRRQFEAVLNRLLAGGAFAGPGPAESFRVTVHDPTGATGQLVVELKVAPSVPLRFLTVRLVQAGDGGLSLEGV